MNQPNTEVDVNIPVSTEWKNPPKLSDLKVDLTQSQSSHSHQMSKIDRWLDYLHAKGQGSLEGKQVRDPYDTTLISGGDTTNKKEKNSKSKVQPKLIRKQAEWRYSALSEPFLSTANLFTAQPTTFEDSEAARQNALVLNHQFNTQINKVGLIDSYVRNTVNEGTGILRVGWEYSDEEVVENVPTFSYTPDFTLIERLQGLIELQQSNPNGFNQLGDDVKESVRVTAETGIPTRATITGYVEQVQRKVICNKPSIIVCNADSVIIDPTCQGDYSKAKFVIYEFETSLSELKASGKYRDLDKLEATLDIQQASIRQYDHSNDSSFSFKDKARKRLIAYEYWGEYDIDGTGITKPVVITWINNVVIQSIENPFPDKKHPFIFVPYLPVKNSVYGEPDGELMADNQDISGAITRGMIDILAKNAVGQRGYAKGFLTPANQAKFEKGSTFEYNPIMDVTKGVYVTKFADIPTSAQYMLNIQHMEADSISGIKAFHNGLTGDSLGTTATGVRTALDATSLREMGILRRLANGLIEAGYRIAAMNSEFLSDKEIVRVTNESFVTIDREALKGRFDLTLSISTNAADNQKASELAFMLQTGSASMDAGEVRLIRAEIARLRKMPELAKRIETYEPQPDPMAQLKAELEIKKLDMEIKKLEAETMRALADSKVKSSAADKSTLDFVEQESGITHAREIAKQQAQAEGNMKLELLKSTLDTGKGKNEPNS